MPYIITIWHNEDAAPTPVIPKPKDTRKAVATLDEALSDVSTIVCNLMAGENFGQYQDQFRAIDESGGTVGSLPDGTVIEVRPTHWDVLAARAEIDHRVPHARILAAFNNQ